MNSRQWPWLKRLLALLESPSHEPAEQTRRVLTLQRNIILPARLLVIAIVYIQFYTSQWLGVVVNTYGVVLETIQNTLAACSLVMLAGTVLFYVVRRFPPGTVQWIVFAIGLADGFFLASLTVLTGGFESILYWVFPALIVLNAVSIPLATPQLVLNIALAILFVSAGYLESGVPMEIETPRIPKRNTPAIFIEEIKNPEAVVNWMEKAPEPFRKFIWDDSASTLRTTLAARVASPMADTNLASLVADEARRILSSGTRVVSAPSAHGDSLDTPSDPNVLRVALLILLTFCCYGLQLLVARERRRLEDQQEFLVRTGQLRSAGRLAAEIAHQIKNPLTVINNVTFILKRSLEPTKPAEAAQVEIIREEVAKADRVITQIMGYAQLSEGRVEKINVLQELNRVTAEVFPPGVPTGTTVHCSFDTEFPALQMQPRHFSDTVSNLLQNARDATDNHGNVFVSATRIEDDAVKIVVRDDGPGIPPDRLGRIFEAYFTTKPRGSGLGLAVVKHNVELYGGSVTVESELGKGAKFTLIFPSKTLGLRTD